MTYQSGIAAREPDMALRYVKQEKLNNCKRHSLNPCSSCSLTVLRKELFKLELVKKRTERLNRKTKELTRFCFVFPLGMERVSRGTGCFF